MLKSSWRHPDSFLLPSAWLLSGPHCYRKGWGIAEWDLDSGRCHCTIGVARKSTWAPDPANCWERQQHGACEGRVTLSLPNLFISPYARPSKWVFNAAACHLSLGRSLVAEAQFKLFKLNSRSKIAELPLVPKMDPADLNKTTEGGL